MRSVRPLLTSLAGCLLAALLLAALAEPASAALRRIDSFSEGGFAGSAHADEVGLASCGALGKFSAAGIAFALSINQDREREWSLNFIKLDWQMRIGERRPVRLRADGGAWRSLTAIAGSPTALVLILPRDPQLLAALRRARIIELEIGGEVLRADLAGIDRVFARVQQCVDQHLAAGGGSRPSAGGAQGGGLFAGQGSGGQVSGGQGSGGQGSGGQGSGGQQSGAGQPAPGTAQALRRAQPLPAGQMPQRVGLRRLSLVKVGKWQVGGYLVEKTGVFAGCTATAFYLGVMIDLGALASGLPFIGFDRERWGFAVGQVGEAQIRIGEGPWHAVRTRMESASSLWFYASAADGAALRTARSVDIRVGGETSGYQLEDMEGVSAALAACTSAGAALARRDDRKPDAGRGEEKPPAGKAPEISTGTGIVVSAAGHVVTNFHVAGECKAVTVQRSGQPAVKAALVVGDEKNDLALLKAEMQPGEGEVAPIGSRPMAAGAPIAVYGFPLSGALSSTGNITAGNISALAGLGNDINFFQISAPVQPGNSGGPLLDYRGDVVGVIQSRIDDRTVVAATGTVPQTVNFAIKALVLQNFLEVHSVDYRSGKAEGASLDLPGIAAAAQKFTVLVTCEG